MIYASQTNSASGHPLVYKQFSSEEKQKFLKEKNLKMLLSGFKNLENVKPGIIFFLMQVTQNHM